MVHDARSVRILLSKAVPLWLQISSEELRLHTITKSSLPYLPDFLDLGATLADQRATLTSRHDQPQCHRRLAGSSAVAH